MANSNLVVIFKTSRGLQNLRLILLILVLIVERSTHCSICLQPGALVTHSLGAPPAGLVVTVIKGKPGKSIAEVARGWQRKQRVLVLEQLNCILQGTSSSCNGQPAVRLDLPDKRSPFQFCCHYDTAITCYHESTTAMPAWSQSTGQNAWIQILTLLLVILGKLLNLLYLNFLLCEKR